jgi:hypothetical protein
VWVRWARGAQHYFGVEGLRGPVRSHELPTTLIA